MSARRAKKKQPVEDLPRNWNVYRFPTGKATVELTGEQRQRACMYALNVAYNAMYRAIDSNPPGSTLPDDFRRAMLAVDAGLNMMELVLESRGVWQR